MQVDVAGPNADYVTRGVADPLLSDLTSPRRGGRYVLDRSHRKRRAWSSSLSLVLVEHELTPLPIHVVYPTTRLLSAKVRAFAEHVGTTRRACFDEASEGRPQRAGERHDPGVIRVVLGELRVELAADVAHAEVRAIRGAERAATPTAKRAARVIRAGRGERGGGRARETKRAELVVGEDLLRAAAAAVTARPSPMRKRVSARASAARPNARERRAQLFAESSQVLRENDLLRAGLGARRLERKPPSHREHLVGARTRVDHAVDEVASREEQVDGVYPRSSSTHRWTEPRSCVPLRKASMTTALHSEYADAKAEARRIAGAPGDILQRVVAHHAIEEKVANAWLERLLAKAPELLRI